MRATTVRRHADAVATTAAAIDGRSKVSSPAGCRRLLVPAAALPAGFQRTFDWQSGGRESLPSYAHVYR